MSTPSATLLSAINTGSAELVQFALHAYLTADEGCLTEADVLALIECGTKLLSPEQAWSGTKEYLLRTRFFDTICKHGVAPNGAALVDFLNAHFEQLDSSLQQQTLPTLARMRYSAKVGLKITTCLQSRETSDQRAALNALKLLSDCQRVDLAFMELFPPLFRSADWSLRNEAIQTFGKIFAGLEADAPPNGRQSIEVLVRFLEDKSEELVRLVVKAIVSLGDICVTALSKAISSGSPNARSRAIQICWDRREEWYLPETLFSRCIRNPHGFNNELALRMLATSSPAGLIQVQQEFERLSAQESLKLRELATALGQTEAGSRTLVIHALSSEDSPQREAALATLAKHCKASEFDRAQLLSRLDSLTAPWNDPYRCTLTRTAIVVALQGQKASNTPLIVGC